MMRCCASRTFEDDCDNIDDDYVEAEKMMMMSCASRTFEAWLAPAGVMSRRLREAGGVHVAPWEHAELADL